MREKIVRERLAEVRYSTEQWVLLRKFRERANEIIEIFAENGIKAGVYGSVARGDVWHGSDLDIVILQQVKPFMLETLLEQHGIGVYYREIVIATPKSTPKGYIYLDQKTSIHFPLYPLTRNEEEFYRFGGLLGYPGLKDFKNRVLGVDKRLILIKPTEFGHIEESIIGKEEEVAKLLGISLETVKERVKLLSKRDEKGRTGVYIKRILATDESFDQVLWGIISKKPAVRRNLRERGLI